MLFISTMNRTSLASFLTVTMAEYILRMVPTGTHDHTKYCKPDELRDALSTNGCQVLNMAGMHFNPLSNKWDLAHKTPLELQVNYILTAIKK
jgi:2-polyprenyl-6-hydroxyphenyl methylase / 3-demethylubiquinone-9 3-methyltransferase